MKMTYDSASFWESAHNQYSNDVWESEHNQYSNDECSVDYADKEKKPINVNFDIDLDLSMIKKNIIEKVEERVVSDVAKNIETIMFSHRNSYSTWKQNNEINLRNGINEPVKELIVEFMEKYKDEIIQRTAENLTRRLAMSKDIKELKKNAELV